MNYILFNPKSNSEHNDLNIIPGKAELERRGVKQISLLDLDVRGFCSQRMTECSYAEATAPSIILLITLTA